MKQVVMKVLILVIGLVVLAVATSSAEEITVTTTMCPSAETLTFGQDGKPIKEHCMNTTWVNEIGSTQTASQECLASLLAANESAKLNDLQLKDFKCNESE